MRKLLVLFCLIGYTLSVSAATPMVSDVRARQRYPWNGLVDIEFKVNGLEEGSDKGYMPFAVATNLETMASLPVNSLKLWQGGTNTSAAVITSNGTYKLIWDAATDVGEVVVSNLLLCLDVRPTSIIENGHRGIQLWESGPYWAECNIGAENPEDHGYYFWWGDTVGYKRENNAWVASDGSNANFFFGSSNTPTYNKTPATLESEGWVVLENGTCVLAPEHDAAQVKWGGGWRMPTYQELYDLCFNKCDWTWTTLNGVNGRIVRGRGDYAANSIFLPCAGYGDRTSLYDAGSYGYYWSSVPDSDSSYGYVYGLYFNLGRRGTNSDYHSGRFLGQSVRPVQGFAN